jgi:transcriptional regulator
MTKRSDRLQGTLPMLVLTILSRRGPLHGYAITACIHELSDVLRVEEGSLYPALHRMEEARWIKARMVTTEHNRRVRAYEITAAGRRQLDTEQQRWRSTTDAVNYVLKHA